MKKPWKIILRHIIKNAMNTHKSALELIINNMVSWTVVIVSIVEWLPIVTSSIVAGCVAWYNIEKALKMRQERKNNQENEEI